MNEKCSLCGKPTSWERENIDQPPEGEVCSICGSWVCPDCVNWSFLSKEHDIICKPCSSLELVR